MSQFTDQHRKGIRAFTASLEHKSRTCRNCGFEDFILHSDWKTHVQTEPKSGHIVYRLTCPNCTADETVEINI